MFDVLNSIKSNRSVKLNMRKNFKTIDNLAKTLASLQPLKPEYQQRLNKKIRLEFNYNSNHIEGNTLTYGETELLLFFDKNHG
jgi:Fic family protein